MLNNEFKYLIADALNSGQSQITSGIEEKKQTLLDMLLTNNKSGYTKEQAIDNFEQAIFDLIEKNIPIDQRSRYIFPIITGLYCFIGHNKIYITEKDINRIQKAIKMSKMFGKKKLSLEEISIAFGTNFSKYLTEDYKNLSKKENSSYLKNILYLFDRKHTINKKIDFIHILYIFYQYTHTIVY